MHTCGVKYNSYFFENQKIIVLRFMFFLMLTSYFKTEFKNSVFTNFFFIFIKVFYIQSYPSG